MKLKIYINLVFSLCLTVVSLSSCSDDSIGAEYGNTLIYMPQATHNLGIDNNLNLTVNVDEASEDPSVKTSTTLGIYRSGTAPKETVTVDLIIDTDSLARAKALAEENPEASAYDIYRTGVLLEEQYYESGLRDDEGKGHPYHRQHGQPDGGWHRHVRLLPPDRWRPDEIRLRGRA